MSIYRTERVVYFDLAMQSIWENQTYQPDEIILVQDGPLTDELYESLKYWKKKILDKLILVPLETNVGLTRALNIGIPFCSGRYIARMDTDDICYPHRFELQIQFLELHQDISVLGTGMQEINENGKLMHLRTYPSKMDQIINYIPKASPLAHPTVMIRNELFNKGFRYNEKYRKSQDVDLWFRVIDAGYRISNLPCSLVYFRRTQKTYKKRKNIKSSWDELFIYFHGIKRLYGLISWRYIYPITRFCIKLFPSTILKFIYNSFFVKKYNY
ncbi:putative glycosyltransferase EpsE [termite gut metagenome]|uniref:Putative glycosyltransferase EpsE n=1 Tax=termite gut metagenome TaxID=433724 RepID=A0A5J4RK61_9ZZZZ